MSKKGGAETVYSIQQLQIATTDVNSLSQTSIPSTNFKNGHPDNISVPHGSKRRLVKSLKCLAFFIENADIDNAIAHDR